MHYKLSVVIVSYNVKYYLEQCLDSVFRAVHDLDAEVYVIDNHSHDATVDYIAKRFPQVHLIDSNHNLGFSCANNIAIRQSKGEYVLLLNPDTIVGEQVLQQAVDFMDQHPDAGALGVRMIDPNGSDARESRRGLPTPMVSFYKMCGLCQLFPKHPRYGKYYMSGLPWDEQAPIEVVSGAFFLSRRDTLDKVGLLDEDFFMYGEDIDLSCRILKSGYQNWYLPLRILHYKGESSRHTGFRYVHVFYDAMLIFLRKHYGQQSFFLTIPIKLAIYGKAFLALMRMLYDRMKKSLGFFLPNEQTHADYIFIGSKENLEACVALAKKKGLSCIAVKEGTGTTLPDGHHSLNVPVVNGRTTYVVYDTSVYSYEQLFNIFGEHQQQDVLLATYHPATKTIITPNEIFR